MARQVISKEDLDLLGELGVDTAPKRQAARTPLEQRVIAGYEEIEHFVGQHGRLPEHGENRDILERLYAVRLDQLGRQAECREALEGIDVRRLLDVEEDGQAMVVSEDAATDEELLEALGVSAESSDDITQLKHVRPSKEKLAAEEIARRTPCASFGISSHSSSRSSRTWNPASEKPSSIRTTGKSRKATSSSSRDRRHMSPIGASHSPAAMTAQTAACV